MAVQLINIGNTANDGTGDDLREAFVKVNANFNELDLRDDEQTTVTNLGSTGEGLFKERINYDLKFKKIVGGAGISLTVTDDNITIANDKVYDLTQSTVTGDPYVTKEYDFADARIKYNNVYQNIADLPNPSTYHGLFAHVHSTGGAYYSHGGAWIELANKSDALELLEDTTPVLGGNLDAAGYNISNAGTIASTGFTGPLTGNVTGLVNGVDPATYSNRFTEMDFGAFSQTVSNMIDFRIAQSDVEMGSITAEEEVEVDFGPIAV